MKTRYLLRRRQLWVPPLLFLVLIFVVWEGSVRLLGTPVYVLPPPSVVAADCIAVFPDIWKDFLVTLSEVVLGFLLGSLVAFLAAMAFVFSDRTQAAVYPYAIALKSIPIVAVAPLLILWCGNGLLGKVVMAGLICFFPVLVNMVTGLRSVDSDALDLFRSLAASRIQTMFRLRLPSSLPFLFSGLKVGSSLAVVGAIVAEFAGANSGLGFAVMVASYRLETIRMFSAIFYIAFLGLSFFGLVSVVERIAGWTLGYSNGSDTDLIRQ